MNVSQDRKQQTHFECRTYPSTTDDFQRLSKQSQMKWKKLNWAVES